ncbi:MAG: hypothetical protein EXS13_11760 [Planctomycetes bacterium]|nr:hypothetical protein [Planctomycetota bacterium]
MDPATVSSTSAPAATTAPSSDGPVVTLGDRLLIALWIAFALAFVRAALQAVVDATADEESGTLLAEHLVEHVVDATARTWWLVPLLAMIPRPRRVALALVRGGLVALACGVSMIGWPDGPPRYVPGIDSLRGGQGWAVVVTAAVILAALERFATSPKRTIFQWAPATRLVTTSAVLLLGGGALLTLVVVFERRRLHLEMETVVDDLLDEIAEARIAPAPGGQRPSVGSLIAPRDGRTPGGNLPSLLLPVGAAIEFDVELMRQSRLRFSIAVDRAAVVTVNPPSQLLTFAVLVDGVEVQTNVLRPQERPEDRRWIDCEVALTALEERTARIGFALRGQGGGLAEVRAGFGRPRVVRQEWRARVQASSERMNVVVIAVDALRADHLGSYGSDRGTSPAIDALASEGILYEQARASSTWSWPAVATLLTGLYPATHGVDDIDRCFLSDSLVTLPEMLAARGCTTLCATANPLITRSKNFDQGFADWREFPQQPAARVVDQFSDWVHRYGAWQFFALLHLHDPHRPFNPPEVVATRFVPREDVAAMRRAVIDMRLRRSTQNDPSRAHGPVAAEEDVIPQLSQSSWIGLYDAEVRYVDEQVARVLTQLRRSGLEDKTIVVVVGTYGETLAMAAPPAAGSSLARELRHVPLVIYDPRQPKLRVTHLVDLTFLAPTLAQLAGAPLASAGLAAFALPPFGTAVPRYTYFHTARGEVAGEARAMELLGLESDDASLVMRRDGTVIQFDDDRPRTNGKTVDRLPALKARLLRWHELTRRDAVARPFERLDFATSFALDLLAEPEGSR